MEWKLDRTKPVCPQICERIYVGIASGELAPGERLMSVRDVALAAGVNPNTVQKSFEELERAGAVYSVRGSGWYAAEDTTAARGALDGIVKAKAASFVGEMKSLGVDCKKVREYLEEYCHE